MYTTSSLCIFHALSSKECVCVCGEASVGVKIHVSASTRRGGHAERKEKSIRKGDSKYADVERKRN